MLKRKTKKIKRYRENNIIVVKSRAYGEHTRAARGSIKPAKLNEALATKVKDVVTINCFASEVHNLIKMHAGHFKEGMFWQKILSRMHKANVMKPAEMLGTLTGLELNSRYPLRRFTSQAFTMVTMLDSVMQVHLRSNHVPENSKKATQYRFDLSVLFFNEKGKVTGDTIVSTKWFSINEAAGTTMFNINIPKDSMLYLICLRLHGGKNNEALNELGTQGMAIARTGAF